MENVGVTVRYGKRKRLSERCSRRLQASALDTRSLAAGRDIGSVRVRDRGGRDLAHDVMFAFAFHAFWPKGRWMLK